MAQIRSNITTKIVGKISEEDIGVLVEKFGCKPIESYLNLISDPENNQYKHCFAIQYDTGKQANKAIFKTFLPDYMLAKFNTRDSVVMQ